MKNQSGIIHAIPLLLIVAAIGIISFLLISSTVPLSGLFGVINPKPASQAATSALPSPFPNCTPFGGVLPNGQAAPPFNPTTRIGGLEAEPQGPIWCFPLITPDTTATSVPGHFGPTRITGANDWVDDFNTGVQMGRFNDRDMGYRIFDFASPDAGQPRIKDQMFLNANHWMVDMGITSPYNLSGGMLISPDRSFQFENGKLVIEADGAAGQDGAGGADVFYEIDVSPASAPTGITVDSLYGYGEFGGVGAVGCRLESAADGMHTVCSQYDNSRRDAGGIDVVDHSQGPRGRLWETQGGGTALTGATVTGGTPLAAIPGTNLHGSDVFRKCLPNQMDYYCRDRIRMELTKTSLTLFVNGYKWFDVQNLTSRNSEGRDARIADSFFGPNGVRVYLSSWINGDIHHPVRLHWDRIAVNPHDIPGHAQPPTSAPSYCLGQTQNTCPVLTQITGTTGINVPQKNQVDILDFVYNQQNTSITVGDTITWTNKGTQPHSATSDSGTEINSPILNSGQTYSHTFTQPGVYSYHCIPHPGMTGTITVYPANGSPLPSSSTVAPTPSPSPVTSGTTFTTTMNGAKNVPVVTTGGTGNATLILSQAETAATLTMSFSGLTSAVNAAHIHGPATTTQSAGVLFPLNFGSGTAGTNLVTTITGLTTAQVADLKNGLWYVNVHSTNFPNGEIRGQFAGLTPSPTPIASCPPVALCPQPTTAPGQSCTVSRTQAPQCTCTVTCTTAPPSPTPGTCPKGPIGDANCDGAIDIFDYSAVVTHFNQTGTNIAGDINRDGVVDIFDYSLVVTHFGQ